MHPRFGDLILPLALALVVLLFAGQRFGTSRIGVMFGPVMVVWFLTIGILGGIQIAASPTVLAAASASYAVTFFLDDPARAFLTLGTPPPPAVTSSAT